MAAVEQREKERTGIPKLKVGYNKVFGYYIEISKSYASQAPEDYIRKQTLTNCERFITPELKELEARMHKAVEEREEKPADLMNLQDGRFYKGTLRSGQVLESETSVIILGDVNPGARVISKGNVIVLGTLKGNIFVGAAGNEAAFVAALSMDPMQIRIGDVIARCSDGAPAKKKKKADDTPRSEEHTSELQSPS